jgi:hypothetical protein
MWSKHLDYFELEVTTFKPTATTESLRAQFPANVEWFNTLLKPDPINLIVNAIQVHKNVLSIQTDKIDCGSLLIYFNDGQAYTRLHEHCGWIMRDPLRAEQAHKPTQFLDEDGKQFSISFGNTLSRAQALNLLDHWISTGDTPAELQKSPE